QGIETNLATGNAIEIDASNVVLDLNGHKLGNLTAGPGTQATGIFVDDRKNVTIKNGMVRGFLTGIFLSNAGHSSGNIIESIRADLNIFLGMEVDGTGNTIRHNLVVATGGTTVPAFGIDVNIYGINVDGTENQILDNEVVNTVGVGAGDAVAIRVHNGSAMVDRNRVSNAALQSGGGSSYGIFVTSGGTDVLVLSNRIATVDFGVFYAPSATGKYGRNRTRGVTTPFTGGTASVGNND